MYNLERVQNEVLETLKGRSIFVGQDLYRQGSIGIKEYSEKVNKIIEDYKKYGLGVFAYTRNDIAKSYYKQNGKRMPVADSSE